MKTNAPYMYRNGNTRQSAKSKELMDMNIEKGRVSIYVALHVQMCCNLHK